MAVSWIAVLLCGLATLLIGGLWYSPLLFAAVWQREAGVTDEALRSGSMPLRFGGAFVLGTLAGAVFALFIGTEMTIAQATAAGAAAGSHGSLRRSGSTICSSAEACGCGSSTAVITRCSSLPSARSSEHCNSAPARAHGTPIGCYAPFIGRSRRDLESRKGAVAERLCLC